jgi:hypothetical protein
VIHAVTYDLHNPGRYYEPVIARIKTLADSWAHPQGSLWFVDTLLTPEQWVQQLKACGDANDEFFVVQLQYNWWSVNTDADVVAWLKSPQRRW